MTKQELKEELEGFGAPQQPARVSECIPDELPQVVVAGVLFVMCDDGPVSFDTVTYGNGSNVEVVPGTMMDTKGTLALWRLGKHNVDLFALSVNHWQGE